MLPETPVRQLVNYAATSQYLIPPTQSQAENGVIPLDSLPADWWNYLWNQVNSAVNEARQGFSAILTELNNVIAAAGITPDDTQFNQLRLAIDQLKRAVADATTPGAVKSSSDKGKVSVDSEGIMTANGLGNISAFESGAYNDVPSALTGLKSSAAANLSSAISTEVTNRNTAIHNAINELDVSAVGTSGSYIKTISETNGKISATAQAFDTSITSTSTNAPTSKAVETTIQSLTGATGTIWRTQILAPTENTLQGVVSVLPHKNGGYSFPVPSAGYTGGAWVLHGTGSVTDITFVKRGGSGSGGVALYYGLDGTTWTRTTILLPTTTPGFLTGYDDGAIWIS